MNHSIGIILGRGSDMLIGNLMISFVLIENLLAHSDSNKCTAIIQKHLLCLVIRDDCTINKLKEKTQSYLN
jgi:hypothetical protein